MSRLACHLTVPARGSEHTYQVITGMIMLARAKLIDLELSVGPSRAAGISPHILTAVVDRRLRLTYDMLDGYNLGQESTERELSRSDFYFKRSFDAEVHRDYAGAERIYRYGFNYAVMTRHTIFRRLEWVHTPRSAREITKWALGRDFLTVEDFEKLPRPASANPQVVYLTRIWDPSEVGPGIEAEYLEQMNALRADCIRALRRELGARFVGGLAPTRYANERYPDCVLDSALRRTHFISLLKKSDIGIATRGLFRSNGWSLAEYVASATGIVAETLSYAVPGSFAGGTNYLEFATARECVEQAVELIENPELLRRMKVANYLYYHSYLRPDRLILNTLLTALDRSA